MNPWTPTLTEEDSPLNLSHVHDFLNRQLLQKAKETERAAERVKKNTFAVKERNYETYNYVAGETGDAEAGESDNTLSSILVRAMQRKAKRREIDQAMKMKKLEETKRKLEDEKRRCEYERRKQGAKLREMREAHRLRVLKEDQWRERQMRLARDNKLADEFLKLRLLRYYFQGFKMLVEISRGNKRKAKNHYRQRMLQKAFSKLVINRDQEHHWKEQMAISFYNVTLLNKHFILWREEVSAREIQMARAAQHHQQSLLRRCVWWWRWTAIDLLMQRRADANKASQHYQRTLLLRGLRAWRGYVELRRSRRRRDLVGTRLRGLVKDIVPDFSPPTSDEDDAKSEGVARLSDERWRDLISLMTV